MSESMVAGVDIGGSHITSALVNLKTKKILRETQVRKFVNTRACAEEILDAWSEVIRQSFGKMNMQERRIGIAMPGPFDYNEGISMMQHQNKFDALYGLNVKKLLACKLEIDASYIRFINDAESFLAGEVFGGIASGALSAIGLTLGTGLGSAKYAKGLCEDADLWCSPFLNGIAEDYLSTRWFTSQYQQRTGRNIKDVKEMTLLKEAVVSELFQEFGKNLAIFLNRFIEQCKPEVVVLGGNISRAFPLFEKSLQSHLKKQPFSFRIKQTTLGEDACLVGAGSRWYVNSVTVDATTGAKIQSFK